MVQRDKYFDREQLRPLANPSNWWGAWLVLHCYLVIGGAIALFALFPNLLTFVLAVALIGSRQLGLAVLMHEAGHHTLFASREVGNRVGQWFCALPILADLPAYRAYHRAHHIHTQTERDPDLVLSKPFPTTRRSLLRKLWRDLSGQTGVKLRYNQVKYALQSKKNGSSERLSQAFNGPKLRDPLIANVVIAILLGVIGEWWWWFAFWALPLLTWFQVVVRIRNIAEHGAVEFSDDPLRNVRTTKTNLLTALFIAPYWVNYHLEHHIAMHVPCWNLPRVHALLLKRGFGADMNIGNGYREVLTLAASRA